MRKASFIAFTALMLMSWFIPAQPIYAQNKPASKPLALKVGDTAPDFTLLAFDGKELKKISLRDYHGKKNVALAFYVFAFTGG